MKISIEGDVLEIIGEGANIWIDESTGRLSYEVDGEMKESNLSNYDLVIKESCHLFKFNKKGRRQNKGKDNRRRGLAYHHQSIWGTRVELLNKNSLSTHLVLSSANPSVGRYLIKKLKELLSEDAYSGFVKVLKREWEAE